MVVIVEGLDGVGKTTLCKQIVEKYNFEYIKESHTDDDKIKQDRLIQVVERLFDNHIYIYDRSTLIDDFVYQFLNEKPSSLIQYQKLIMSVLSHCCICHLIIDESIRKQRFNQRGDQYVTNDMIAAIAVAYGIFYADLPNVHFIELDLDNNKNVEKIMEVIKNDKSFTHSSK